MTEERTAPPAPDAHRNPETPSESPAPPPGADAKPQTASSQEEDLRKIPTAAAAEMARSGALFAGSGGGMKAGGFRVSRVGCILLASLIVVLLWVGMAAWVWFDTPPINVYAPVEAPAGWTLVQVAPKNAVALPADWSEETPMRLFLGPDGQRLTVQAGRVADLRMSPKSFGGKVDPSAYTSAAYRKGLRERLPDLRNVAWSRYLRIGRHAGVEVCATASDGDVWRCAVLVEGGGAVELRFRFPGKLAGSDPERSAAWTEATTILKTYRPRANPLAAQKQRSRRSPFADGRIFQQRPAGDANTADEAAAKADGKDP